MASFPESALAFVRLHGYHVGARGASEFVLILAGLAFAGVLIWVIQRSGSRYNA